MNVRTQVIQVRLGPTIYVHSNKVVTGLFTMYNVVYKDYDKVVCNLQGFDVIVQGCDNLV